MNRIKVVTVVGTRPEIIKLSRVIHELDNHTNHILVHSGQNYDYELNELFFEDLGIRKPDYFLEAVGEDVHETIGLIITRVGKLLAELKPDAALFYGDTNTCLGAIAAKREKIPVFHMEAGNRSFDERVPEEINRRILDHISDINLPLTEHAREYLLREGLSPDRVIKSGSMMKEVLHHYQSGISTSDVLDRLQLKSKEFFVASLHREENVDSRENLCDLLDSLNAIARYYDRKVVVSTHPRTRKRLDDLPNTDIDSRIHFMKPVGFFDYVKLQMEAYCIISDSGTITEEASILNLPAITVRQAHERPEGMDEGVLIMCGLKAERVLQGVEVAVAYHNEDNHRIVSDYDMPIVSRKIVKTIFSYIDFINRVVWRKTDN